MQASQSPPHAAVAAAVRPTERRGRLNILGVRVDDSPLDESLARCARMLALPPGGAGGRLHQVATVNPEFVMRARGDPAFRHLLNTVDLATPDGVGIIVASAILGRRLRGRTTGVALTERLAALAARDGHRLFLLGAAPGVAAAAGRLWAARYPGLHIAGAYPGSPADSEAEEITARVTAAGADILFVAFGAPAQDLWIARHAAALPSVRLALGVGGVFDYLTGRVPLAPPLVRRVGLEWLYRLYQQPWRWRRMLALPAFVAAVLGQRLGLMRPAPAGGSRA
ncbi:MAG TPA: WecB/TagA/CpsF family glycosyltransferase [Chloroflexia bacterium]|nr:WecB/TagA/CpsF family glycosyltransferase [Chloroflexia bacterium]